MVGFSIRHGCAHGVERAGESFELGGPRGRHLHAVVPGFETLRSPGQVLDGLGRAACQPCGENRGDDEQESAEQKHGVPDVVIKGATRSIASVEIPE